MIDYNMLKSYEGSLSDPKWFPIKLFHTIIFPKVDKLVSDKEKFDGYILVVNVIMLALTRIQSLSSITIYTATQTIGNRSFILDKYQT